MTDQQIIEMFDRKVVIDVDQANTEEAIKQKLIAMGWTPPKDDSEYRDES